MTRLARSRSSLESTIAVGMIARDPIHQHSRTSPALDSACLIQRERSDAMDLMPKCTDK